MLWLGIKDNKIFEILSKCQWFNLDIVYKFGVFYYLEECISIFAEYRVCALCENAGVMLLQNMNQFHLEKCWGLFSSLPWFSLKYSQGLKLDLVV